MGEHPKTEEFTTQEYFETLRTSISVALQQGAKIIIPTK
jgi:hypothetical protein